MPQHQCNTDIHSFLCRWCRCFVQTSEVSTGSGGTRNVLKTNDISDKSSKNNAAGQHAMPATNCGRPDGSSYSGPDQLSESIYVRSRDGPNSCERYPVRGGARAGVLGKVGRYANKRQTITAGSRLLQVRPSAIDVNIPSKQRWFGFEMHDSEASGGYLLHIMLLIYEELYTSCKTDFENNCTRNQQQNLSGTKSQWMQKVNLQVC